MIEASDVSVTFGTGFRRRRTRALDGFSLQVQEGDFCALLGQNGAGKSTAMHCFLGLIRPERGSVRVLGRRPVPGDQVFNEIAYLPEEPIYHPYLTVEEAVAFYAALYRNGGARAAVSKALERVGLTEFRTMRVRKCSKGMKQKVGIAQCLLLRPRLMFLDEPTRGLDPLMARSFREILLELNRGGTTILMNSHVLSETEMVANRVAIIDRGKVVKAGALTDLLRPEREWYEVEVEAAPAPSAGWPPSLAVTADRGTTATGTVPAERLYPFMAECEALGARVVRCALQRPSLEDVYVTTVKGE